MKLKHIISVFIVIILCVLCFSSCEKKPAETTATTTNQNGASSGGYDEMTSLLGITLEPDRTDLPSYEKLCKIKRDMTVKEVYELVGNPQRIEPHMMSVNQTGSSAHNIEVFVYDSSDGESIGVLFSVRLSDNKFFVSDTTIVSTDDEVASYFGVTLEPDKSSLPSCKEFGKIQSGMTKKEVYELIGNPQRIERHRIPTSTSTNTIENTLLAPAYYVAVYDSHDGDSIGIFFNSLKSKDSEDNEKYVVLEFIIIPKE